MYKLQNRIIQNTSIQTNYLLVNNLKRINVSFNLNCYKSTLTSNVHFTNLRTLPLNTTQQNGLFIKNKNLNNPSPVFKCNYSTESKPHIIFKI